MSRVALDGMWVPRVVSCALFVNDAISTKMNSYQCLCSLFAQQQQHRTHCAPSTANGTRCHSLGRHSFTLSCRYPIIKSKIHWSFADALPSTQNERCVSIFAREATLSSSCPNCLWFYWWDNFVADRNRPLNVAVARKLHFSTNNYDSFFFFHFIISLLDIENTFSVRPSSHFISSELIMLYILFMLGAVQPIRHCQQRMHIDDDV